MFKLETFTENLLFLPPRKFVPLNIISAGFKLASLSELYSFCCTVILCVCAFACVRACFCRDTMSVSWEVRLLLHSLGYLFVYYENIFNL